MPALDWSQCPAVESIPGKVSGAFPREGAELWIDACRMRILFDNGTPRGLARFLAGHSVEEARARGWEELTNGELIEVAEKAGFDLIVTTDKNIRYRQNLKTRRIALVV